MVFMAVSGVGTYIMPIRRLNIYRLIFTYGNYLTR